MNVYIAAVSACIAQLMFCGFDNSRACLVDTIVDGNNVREFVAQSQPIAGE